MESNIFLYTAFFKIRTAYSMRYSLHIDKNQMLTVYPVTRTFIHNTVRNNYGK